MSSTTFWKTLGTIFSITAVVILILMVSCASYITPAKVDRQAKEYVMTSLGKQESDYKPLLGYDNLATAEAVRKDVDNAYVWNQEQILQMATDDQLVHDRLAEVASYNVKIATDLQNQLFSPDGYLALGLSALGFGGVGALLFKRPGDVQASEVNTVVEAKVKPTAERLAKVETGAKITASQIETIIKKNHPEVWAELGPALKSVASTANAIMPDKV